LSLDAFHDRSTSVDPATAALRPVGVVGGVVSLGGGVVDGGVVGGVVGAGDPAATGVEPPLPVSEPPPQLPIASAARTETRSRVFRWGMRIAASPFRNEPDV